MKNLILFLILSLKLFALEVLVLNSYEETLSWTKIQNDTIIKTLNSANIKNLHIYTEFMDTKVLRINKKRDRNLLNFYKNKYQNIIFDIIFTTDDNAINFVIKHKNEKIFKKAKVFFSGVNNLSLDNKLDKNLFAGVFEKKDPIANIELAKKISKNMKTFYLISDDSITAGKTIKQYQNELKDYPKIKQIYLNSKNFEDILEGLKNFDKNSVIMNLVSGSFQYRGSHIDQKEVFNILSSKVKLPILVHVDIFAHLQNCNIIGGNCVTAEAQGESSAKKAIRFINGAKMNQIGFDKSGTNRIFINVLNLKKFGLSPNDLGYKDVILVNKPETFYQKYKVWLYVFAFIVFIIIFFQLTLSKKNLELKEYTKKIEELNATLEDKIKDAIEDNLKKDKLLQQQSKLASMGEMIGAIAHQWRQPLNAISINIQNLEDYYEDGLIDEKFLEEFISKNLKIISYMSNTIDDFRNFFRIDKKKSHFSVKKVIKNMKNIQKDQLEHHKIKLEITGDDFEAFGFESEFGQVILNLVNNAKDAIEHNKIENGNVIIDINSNNKTITVLDNAGGINKSIIDRIFEPYFTTKEQGKGTGLGLYMSKMIIEQNMNGELSVENSDNGTKFKVVLNE